MLLQQDAIERRGMKQLLFEPEILAKVEPSIDLASTVLALKNLVPEKAKAAARDLVRRVVEELRKRLESQIRPGHPRRARPQPAQPVSQPAQPRLAAHDPPQPEELQPRAEDDHPRAHLVLQPAAAAERVERDHRHGPVRLDGDVADLRRHHGGDPGQHAGAWRRTSSRSITRKSSI